MSIYQNNIQNTKNEKKKIEKRKETIQILLKQIILIINIIINSNIECTAMSY